ncbi:MAG: encapsulin-associated ferritin-like protein [Spirochaetaceae bacterium]
MSDYHEPTGELSAPVRDQVRVLHSLREEVEAVDWYNQRLAVTSDPAVRDILRHNRDEEMEHAAMTLEWLRRNMDGWDEALRTYLFTQGDLLEIEEAVEGTDTGGGDGPVGSSTGEDLGIGSMKGKGGDQ